jgi:hypothetical protein
MYPGVPMAMPAAVNRDPSRPVPTFSILATPKSRTLIVPDAVRAPWLVSCLRGSWSLPTNF